MTGYTREQEERLAAAFARKADLDRRAAVIIEQTKQAQRARGEPVLEDFASRSAYRAAASKFRRKGRS